MSEQVRHGSVGKDDDFAIITAWNVEDVKTLDDNLDTEACIEILESILHRFDASMGISWTTLEVAIDEWRQTHD